MEIFKNISKLLCIISLFFGCNQNEWQNSHLVKFESGTIKEIRYWNKEMHDELSFLFSESGDTLEVRRILHPHMAVAKYNGDTIDYRFYIIGEDSIWYINEWLICANNKIVNELSSYVFLAVNNYEFEFSYIGFEIDQFSLLLFTDIDLSSQPKETIASDITNVIAVERNRLKNHKVIGLIRKKVYHGTKEFSNELHILLSNHEKREFQKLFMLNKYLE